MKTPILAAAVLALAAALSTTLGGCGRQGDLERPRRVGDPAPAEKAETERAPRSAFAPALPNPATSTQSAREVPIDGAGNDPRGGPGSSPRS